MEIQHAIKQRFSCRAYQDRTVPLAVVHEMLKLASAAPSSVNMQPWHVAVVTGACKQRLQADLEESFGNQQESNDFVQSYPDTWSEPYLSRRRAVGKGLYKALDITRDDRPRQREQWQKNYRAFDAPVMLIFAIDDLPEGALLDVGLYMQTLMLLSTAEGLATCAQYALASYPDIIKRHIPELAAKNIVCGMALGYPDMKAPENQWRTERASTEQFVSWHG